MSKGDFFSNFKVSKPEFNLLPAGEHVVRIVRSESTTSFNQFDGTEKSDLPAWNDPTPQLAITVVAAEEGKSGGMTHRLNGRGYVKMSELTAEQLASGDFQDENGYACTINNENLLVRVVSEKHTQECANILNQFANALGIKEGSKLDKGIEDAKDKGTKFVINIVNKPYGGKDQLRIEKFKMYAAPVAASFED